MRKNFVVASLALLSLAACTTEKEAATTTAAPQSTVPSTGGSTPTESTEPTGSTITPVVDPRAPGVAADSVKIGISLLDLSTVKDLIGYDQGDPMAAYQAVIDEVNANGGVNGRQLEPVFTTVNPNTSDVAAAACTKLTQDEQVFVDVGVGL